MPLRLALSSMAEMSMDDEVFIASEQLPDLPGELCGIWAYIQWEAAGCPNRSAADSDNAYQQAIQVCLQRIACVVITAWQVQHQAGRPGIPPPW